MIHARAIPGSPHGATPTRQTGVDETGVDDVFQHFPFFHVFYFSDFLLVKKRISCDKSPKKPTVRAFVCVEEL